MTQLKCYLHFPFISYDAPQPFTSKRWETFKNCARKWLNLSGESDCFDIARKNENVLDVEFDHIPRDAGFHPTCYQKFINKKDIERCENRKKRRQEASTDIGVPSAAKKLRSKSAEMAGKARHVLPVKCIICKKAARYTRDRVQQKCVMEPLMLAETLTAGKLLESATKKRDDSILMHIHGRDCVALEVRYHKSCYLKYCWSVTQDHAGTGEDIRQKEDPSQEAYKYFCDDVIETRIIRKGEKIGMKRLVTLYAKYMKGTVYASSLRSDALKRRLSQDFPSLIFHQPPQRNRSQIVYAKGTMVDTLKPDTSTGTSELSDNGPSPTAKDAPADLPPSRTSSRVTSRASETLGPDVNETRQLFSAALIIKRVIENTGQMTCPWPPTAADLSPDAAKNIVPTELYNFLAWCVGLSDEPDSANFVAVDTASDAKLTSICQDVVYLASNGRKQTPKSLALGMAIRHLTGSSRVLSMVNKFGHCASRNTIVGLETSLAELRLVEGQNHIPHGFSKSVPTVLIWDNIDFGEETLSGKGTTHHTNGIMVQARVTDRDAASPRVSLSKGARTLYPPIEELEEYHIRTKQGPVHITEEARGLIFDDRLAERFSCARAMEAAFAMCKVPPHTLSTIPGWTAFHASLNRHKTLEKSAIHYMPVIEHPSTDMSTVKEILNKSSEMADRLSLTHMVLVFDQAIYAKIQQIRWTDESLRERFIVRLGDFHTSMAFMAVIGKRFLGSGLRDILIESGVVAEGSINGVLSGHHYNRSLRAHKLLAESLMRMRFEGYLDSLSEESERSALELLHNMANMYPSNDFVEMISSEDFSRLLSDYGSYVRRMIDINPTFAFWSSYLDMVEVLLVFIRATRESDWDLHLAAWRSMLAWFFAYDRINYARYGTAYFAEMVSIPISHPGESFTARGEWTVQRSGAGFSSIACDQAIEQTINRDSKTPGGLIGISLNRGAVQRWILSQNERAAIVRQCENMANSIGSREGKDCSPSAVKADAEAVQSIISTIESMQNPFDPQHSELVCISSGVIASRETQNEMIAAKEIGECALKQFIDNRVIAPSEDFFAPIKARKLKTFSHVTKAKTKSGKEVSLRNDARFLARMLLIAQMRQLYLRDVLCYTLSPVSLPLASVDGCLAKTNKSALLDAVENVTLDCTVTDVPNNCALIIDGMSLIHSLRNVYDSFGLLANGVLKRVLQLARKFHCSRVDFVTDRYPEIAIKSCERVRRGEGEGQTICIMNENQKPPTQWKKYLKTGKNKEDLVEFLFRQWSSADQKDLKNISLFITHGYLCHRIYNANSPVFVVSIEELRSDHEEADTRLLLHTSHASQTFDSVVIHSPDSDVGILALSLRSNIACRLFFSTGVKNRTRVLDIDSIANTLGEKTANALVGLHVYTGCDSTSAFHGKGKRKPFELIKNSEQFQRIFSELGKEFSPSNILMSELEAFVCHLYGYPNLHDINEVRYRVFCLASSSPFEQSLPPTQNALVQHTRRSSYQAALYRRCLKANICPPSPNEHGWSIHENKLSIVWMTQNVAPDSILEAVNCNCKKNQCDGNRCSCRRATMSCTDLCGCKNCENRTEPAPETVLLEDFDETIDVDLDFI